MERLFSPCNRHRDLVESHGHGRRVPEGLWELNLDVSTDEFLSAERGFTYTDLRALLGNGDTIAWLTPHAVVMHPNERGVYSSGPMEQQYRFYFNADGEDIHALSHSSEQSLEICDVVLRLLAASAVHSVILDMGLS
jgi:hypothetical protein